jgi:hypothetical protein
LGVAVTVTCVPVLYRHPPEHAGLIVPPPDGLTLVISWYCMGAKLAVTVIGPLIVIPKGFETPVALPLKFTNW